MIPMKNVHILLSLLAFVLLGEAIEKCSDLAKVADQYLVETDPYPCYEGVYANVWVKGVDAYTSLCSYSIYTQKSDGTIEEDAKYIDLRGEEMQIALEYLSRSTTTGILELWGKYELTQEKYFARVHVFFADGNVIGYLACGYSDDSGWNMGIQVKGNKKDMLLLEGPNNVKLSLDQAKEKMDLIMSEYGKMDEEDMDKYDLSKLCSPKH